MLTHKDDLLPVHIGNQVLLGPALTVHVSLALRHTVVRRDRLLQRVL